MTVTIGVDVGGTKVLAGLVRESGTIVEEVREATPIADREAAIALIADAVRHLAAHADEPVSGVGIGVAALVDRSRRTVLFAPNLRWGHTELADRIEASTGIRTVVDNDANAAAWGERVHGAARRFRDVVVVTIGTGIGGGLILGGELRAGAHGMAAEIGHLQVVPEGRECPCGSRGCWEQYGSGRALVRRARELAAERPDQSRLLVALAGGDPERIEGDHVTAAARSGDATARAVFDEIGSWLGVGLADLTAVLDPEGFVIGGGVGDAGELLLDPARRTHARIVGGYGDRPVPEVLAAELGNRAGLIGAAALAR